MVNIRGSESCTFQEVYQRSVAQPEYARRSCGRLSASAEPWIKLNSLDEELPPPRAIHPTLFNFWHHSSTKARSRSDPKHSSVC